MKYNPERAYHRTRLAAEKAFEKERPVSVGLGQMFQSAFQGESKYERLVNLMALLRFVLPESIDDRVKQSFIENAYNSDELPFRREDYNFHERPVDEGAISRVYWLESKTEKPSWALKVVSPGQQKRELSEIADDFKEDYEEIKRIYQECSDIIPEQSYIVMKDPFMKERGALVVMQEFQNGKFQDLFQMTPEEIQAVAEQNTTFRRQFVGFAKATLDEFETSGKVIDFLGKENVSAVGEPGKERLMIVDTHGIRDYYEVPEERQERIDSGLDRMRSALSLVEQSQTGKRVA